MELFAAGSTSSRSVNGMAQTTGPEISSERAYVLLGVNRHSRFHKVAPITPSLRPPTTALAPSENRRFQVTAYVSLLLIRDEWAHLSLRIHARPDFDLLHACRHSFDDFAEDAGPWVSLRGKNTLRILWYCGGALPVYVNQLVLTLSMTWSLHSLPRYRPTSQYSLWRLNRHWQA
jgi:hypothetical protein